MAGRIIEGRIIMILPSMILPVLIPFAREFRAADLFETSAHMVPALPDLTCNLPLQKLVIIQRSFAVSFSKKIRLTRGRLFGYIAK
ncbi:MAG: hypothetical protein NTX50_07835 [Candidatus Sumerlaeota bacterium]|nr:hypothetical protein [Candidatus Sumerlaeota bacterium]